MAYCDDPKCWNENHVPGPAPAVDNRGIIAEVNAKFMEYEAEIRRLKNAKEGVGMTPIGSYHLESRRLEDGYFRHTFINHVDGIKKTIVIVTSEEINRGFDLRAFAMEGVVSDCKTTLTECPLCTTNSFRPCRAHTAACREDAHGSCPGCACGCHEKIGG